MGSFSFGAVRVRAETVNLLPGSSNLSCPTIIVGSMQWCISGFERHADVKVEGSIPLPTAKLI